MNELERIVALTREELERRRQRVPADELAREAEARAGDTRPRSLREALKRPGVAVIAEHKRRSPSAGVIREGVALEDVVGAYQRGGAAALSILTEGPSFGGSLDDLRAARAATELPLLRKDFVVDRYQVDEALLAGADAILLIVAALGLDELRALLGRASWLGLSALVEVHNEHELELALEAGADVIGINNRDLTTLTVDTARTFELRHRIPAEKVVIAESGFSRRDQIELLLQAHVDAVLVGEALMRSPDIELACRSLAGVA
jgi:indole-3-glycerol phosphate synthase